MRVQSGKTLETGMVMQTRCAGVEGSPTGEEHNKTGGKQNTKNSLKHTTKT